MLVPVLLLVSQVSVAQQPQTAQDSGLSEGLFSGVLAEAPYIESLLIKREFPVIGGRWGGKVFIDLPLNGEPDGAEVSLRTAKLKYMHRFGENWRLKLTGVYSRGGGLELSDNYFTYSGWKRTLLTLGISDPAYSLESSSDSAGLTFMEQGLAVAALSENKSGGAFILRRNEHSILNASFSFIKVSQDEIAEAGQGVVLHYVYSPVKEGVDNSIHLGGSFSYRINAEGDSTRFRSRPEVGTVDDYYVDTGPVDKADKIVRISLEANQVIGRFSWQTEVLSAQVRRGHQQAVKFWGGYFFASWFLTGDSRNYDFGSGSYDQMQVSSPFRRGGAGAFELALRASYVDLTDRNVIGGKEKNLSIGLNWYLNQHVRLMANLVKVLDVDRPGSEYDGRDPLIFSLRAQWVLN
jgi:phosphate-selective porin OprO/OprP